MKTDMIVRTGERLFLVQYSEDVTDVDISNLGDLKGLVTLGGGAVKISHFWNGKFTKMSKRDLVEMLEANQLSSEFVKRING